jgi:hypothetical protein
MDQTMPDHLVLALKAFAPLGTRTSFDRAEVWSRRRMDIRMRVQQILRLKWRCRTVRVRTMEPATCNGQFIDGHPFAYGPVSWPTISAQRLQGTVRDVASNGLRRIAL